MTDFFADVHPAHCPEFEYKDHPGRKNALRGALKDLLLRLRGSKLSALEMCADSRFAHQQLFRQLTPKGYGYYAGHYRGEDFPCLRNYRVCVPGDPRVGITPFYVQAAMYDLGQLLGQGLDRLDIAIRGLKSGDFLATVVFFGCQVFETFLRVHPYANGNGHIARLVIWAILGRYNYWPTRFPIEPRPPDPRYTDLIVRFRNGDTNGLCKYILSCLA